MESFRYWLYRHGLVRLISAQSCCIALTTIRRQLAIYFWLHRGKFVGKHGQLARLVSPRADSKSPTCQKQHVASADYSRVMPLSPQPVVPVLLRGSHGAEFIAWLGRCSRSIRKGETPEQRTEVFQ